MSGDVALSVRRHGQAAWPLTWVDRMMGWREGRAFRLDWGFRPVGIADGALPSQLASSNRVLGHPALIAPDRQGRLLAFSPWAVNEAWRVWRHYDLGTIYGGPWFTAWLNGANPGGAVGVRSDCGLKGVTAIDVGPSVVLFCPEILGPLGRVVHTPGEGPPLFGGRLEVSDGIGWRVSQGVLWVRGTGLADGFWRHGRIEPWSEESGWWALPIE